MNLTLDCLVDSLVNHYLSSVYLAFNIININVWSTVFCQFFVNRICVLSATLSSYVNDGLHNFLLNNVIHFHHWHKVINSTSCCSCWLLTPNLPAFVAITIQTWFVVSSTVVQVISAHETSNNLIVNKVDKEIAEMLHKSKFLLHV